MAKTEGQLFSLKAMGTIGNVLTYQGRKGFRHTHKKALPTNPRTPAQIADRLLFANAVAEWQELNAAQKKVYNDMSARYGNIPGFNIYIKLNKGVVTYTTKFGQAKFGANAKFGGP